MSAVIKFCGAARTVTGSCYHIRVGEFSFLIDCGMFQGSKSLKQLNYGPFPFDVGALDFVILTHAHVDHSGLVPKLLNDGFRGNIFSTRATRDLLVFMLPDSGYIQETEVAFLNRRNAQRGKPAVEPIYTKVDGEAACRQIVAREYQEWFSPVAGVRTRFWNAGHILGSASIELECRTSGQSDAPIRMLFSGDVGPEHKLFHPDADAPRSFDYVFCESTYGGRRRARFDQPTRRRNLAEIINSAFARKGVLVIPAFSVERTQELLADITHLIDAGAINETLIFLDSPLAIRATDVFAKYASELEDIDGDGRAFRHPALKFTRSVDESKAVNRYESGVIIIAASGMCEAGRIRHHLKQRLWDSKNTILMTGFQAPGTLGALLESGKRSVKIQGDEVRVAAQIKSIDYYSGHVDEDEIVEWLSKRGDINKKLFLTHGTTEAIEAVRARLTWAGIEPGKIVAPSLDDEFDLVRGVECKPTAAPRRIEAKRVDLPDWHNDLAQLSLDIRDALEKSADDRSRDIILRRLRRALGAD